VSQRATFQHAGSMDLIAVRGCILSLFLSLSHSYFKDALLDAMKPRLAMACAITYALLLRANMTEVFRA
jgi:hypothetical protein